MFGTILGTVKPDAVLIGMHDTVSVRFQDSTWMQVHGCYPMYLSAVIILRFLQRIVSSRIAEANHSIPE